MGKKMENPIGFKELSQIIKSFLQTPKVEEEIEFREPLVLNRSQVLELVHMFGRIRSSLVSSKGDLWIELLNFGEVIVVLTYEEVDYKTYAIHKIVMKRSENA